MSIQQKKTPIADDAGRVARPMVQAEGVHKSYGHVEVLKPRSTDGVGGVI